MGPIIPSKGKGGKRQIRDIYLAGTISELATRHSDFTATLRSVGHRGAEVPLRRAWDVILH